MRRAPLSRATIRKACDIVRQDLPSFAEGHARFAADPDLDTTDPGFVARLDALAEKHGRALRELAALALAYRQSLAICGGEDVTEIYRHVTSGDDAAQFQHACTEAAATLGWWGCLDDHAAKLDQVEAAGTNLLAAIGEGLALTHAAAAELEHQRQLKIEAAQRADEANAKANRAAAEKKRNSSSKATRRRELLRAELPRDFTRESVDAALRAFDDLGRAIVAIYCTDAGLDLSVEAMTAMRDELLPTSCGRSPARRRLHGDLAEIGKPSRWLLAAQ